MFILHIQYISYIAYTKRVAVVKCISANFWYLPCFKSLRLTNMRVVKNNSIVQRHEELLLKALGKKLYINLDSRTRDKDMGL